MVCHTNLFMANNEVPMDHDDIERLRAEIGEIRRAIRKNDPLLRKIASIRLFAVAAIPLGLALVAFFLALHASASALGAAGIVPEAWRVPLIVFLTLFMVLGGVFKIVLIRKEAGAVSKGAGFGDIVKAAYAGSLLHLNLPAILVFAAVAAFALREGRPWLILPASAIFLGLISNSFGILVARREYFAIGWYCVVTGIAALFAVETAPFFWVATLYGLSFIVFGVAGLVASPPGKTGTSGRSSGNGSADQ